MFNFTTHFVDRELHTYDLQDLQMIPRHWGKQPISQLHLLQSPSTAGLGNAYATARPFTFSKIMSSVEKSASFL